MRIFHALLLSSLVAATLFVGSAQAQSSTTFTYQGYLEDSGSPASGPVDLRFILYDSESGGEQVGSTLEKDDVSVTDGVFAVDLDFGAVFADGPRWLEIGVREGGSSGTYTTLSPREALHPTPSSIVAQEALSLPNVTVDGSGRVGIGTTSPSSPLTVAGEIESTTGGITFPDGTTQTTAGVGSGSAWQLGGNSGTDPSSGDFLGTADDTPIELRVDDTRAFRIEPAIGSDGNFNPNIIGGHPSNSVSQFAEGATISGGGFDNGTEIFPNEIGRNFGTIGGGYDNTIDGRGISATIGGGFRNTASAGFATVGGGRSNTADDDWGTVGGGFSNVASGDAATVPGGFRNAADGAYSFAAGHRAKAQNSGAFVWGDSEDADFASTRIDQFLVRAAGGMGVGTNAPSAQLHAENDADRGLSLPTLRAENQSTGAGVAGYFITNGSDATMVVANRDGSGPLLKGFGSNGGSREFEIKNNGSVDFYNGSNRTINLAAPNGDIFIDGSFNSNGADYAELLPRRRPTESVRPGDLVAVIGGKVTKSTDGANRLMIVSTDPAILGNNDDTRAQTAYSPIAFLGQVPVRVRGSVSVGDLLVASGQDDGTARAVSPADWRPERDGPIAGRAWSEKAGAGLGTVTANVGLPQTGVLVERLQRQQSRIDALEDRLTRVDVLEDRLERLEALLHAASGRRR